MVHIRATPRPELDLLNGRSSDQCVGIPMPQKLQAVRRTLGLIDFDPASSPQAQKLIEACRWMDAADGRASLAQPYYGRVFYHGHPNTQINREMLQKIIRDYLASRISHAVLHITKLELLRQEPILLSFPIAWHYTRPSYHLWDPQVLALRTVVATQPAVDIYLPRRGATTIDEEALATFVAAHRPFARITLTENLVPDWERDAIVAAGLCRPKPILLSRGLDRHGE